MRLPIIFASIYLMLIIAKKIDIPSIRAGVVSGFISAIIVNVAFYFIYGFQPMDVIAIIFSLCSAPLFGFFISNKVYGVHVQK